MNLTHHYYYFKKAVPDRICEEIKKYCLSMKDQVAITGGQQGNVPTTKEGMEQLHQKRNSDIVWVSDRWIYKEIHPYVHRANADAGWNFQWDFSEAAQFTKYKLNQHYDWHCDSWDGVYNNPGQPNHGKVRKITSVLVLSDPKDYKGGELEFDFRNLDPDKKRNVVVAKEVAEKGSLIVFPSFVWHRVKPVTKGVRYSMPTWHLGWPYR